MKETNKQNMKVEIINGVKYTTCTKTFGPKKDERTFPANRNSVSYEGRKSVTLGNKVTSL